jgi:hypothetical protein
MVGIGGETWLEGVGIVAVVSSEVYNQNEMMNCPESSDYGFIVWDIWPGPRRAQSTPV